MDRSMAFGAFVVLGTHPSLRQLVGDLFKPVVVPVPGVGDLNAISFRCFPRIELSCEQGMVVHVECWVTCGPYLCHDLGRYELWTLNFLEQHPFSRLRFRRTRFNKFDGKIRLRCLA